MQTWWIGPTIGAAGVVIGLWRGRRADKRLARIEDAVTRRPAQHPEAVNRVRGSELGLDVSTPFLRNVLGTAITRLPEREKLVVTLYFYEELTQAEIAEILGVSPGTVSQVLRRAVERLRGELLGDPPYGCPPPRRSEVCTGGVHQMRFHGTPDTPDPPI